MKENPSFIRRDEFFFLSERNAFHLSDNENIRKCPDKCDSADKQNRSVI